MKRIGTFALLALTFVGSAFADTPVTLAELPEPVTKVIQDYFPASKPVSARKDTDNGKTKFKVMVQYKEITMKVEVLPTGKIVDLDM